MPAASRFLIRKAFTRVCFLRGSKFQVNKQHGCKPATQSRTQRPSQAAPLLSNAPPRMGAMWWWCFANVLWRPRGWSRPHRILCTASMRREFINKNRHRLENMETYITFFHTFLIDSNGYMKIEISLRMIMIKIYLCWSFCLGSSCYEKCCRSSVCYWPVPVASTICLR